MIIIVREDNAKLMRELWEFCPGQKFYGSHVITLTLDKYRLQSRQSRRHKWMTNASYSRSDTRWPHSLRLEDVRLPEDVRQEAARSIVIEVDRIPPSGLPEPKKEGN